MAQGARIGITMRLEQETGRFYLGRDYSERVEAAGGVPVHISLIPKAEYITEVMSGLDGVLLPGSNTDVDPVYYGEEPHPKLGTVIPVKDETDRLVLAEAERRKMPILAICYGMQALNVFRGGTLIQDIGSQVKNCLKHDQGMPVTRASHLIKVAKTGILAGLSSVKNSKAAIRVNTSHHQAVAKVGKGLKATAWAKDGVIECIEGTERGNWVLGVQWHPELMDDAVSDEIFAALNVSL
jgi:putative glutamine amidotransferase